MTSCFPTNKKDDYSTDINELEKFVKFRVELSSAKWKMVNLSAVRNQEKPFRIFASLKINDLDSNFIHRLQKEEDISNMIYLDETTLNYTVSKPLKQFVYKENNYYRLNKPSYSISSIIKDPNLTGYVIVCNKNELFVVIQSE